MNIFTDTAEYAANLTHLYYICVKVVIHFLAKHKSKASFTRFVVSLTALHELPPSHCG